MEREKFCLRCGGKGPFRSDGALRCMECDAKQEAHRREYHRQYHKARQRALERLVVLHQKQFERLMAEEQAKVAAEEDTENGQESRAG